jgi:hypothetical protein
MRNRRDKKMDEMNEIDYSDIYKIYNGVYAPLETKQPPPPPPPPPVQTEEKKRKRKRRRLIHRNPEPNYVPVPMPYPPEIMHTTFHDPVRTMAKTAAEVALGYGIAEFLGIFSKGPYYVGNQHISSMSNERVKEYRRLGLLPPD